MDAQSPSATAGAAPTDLVQAHLWRPSPEPRPAATPAPGDGAPGVATSSRRGGTEPIAARDRQAAATARPDPMNDARRTGRPWGEGATQLPSSRTGEPVTAGPVQQAVNAPATTLVGPARAIPAFAAAQDPDRTGPRTLAVAQDQARDGPRGAGAGSPPYGSVGPAAERPSTTAAVPSSAPQPGPVPTSVATGVALRPQPVPSSEDEAIRPERSSRGSVDGASFVRPGKARSGTGEAFARAWVERPEGAAPAAHGKNGRAGAGPIEGPREAGGPRAAEPQAAKMPVPAAPAGLPVASLARLSAVLAQAAELSSGSGQRAEAAGQRSRAPVRILSITLEPADLGSVSVRLRARGDTLDISLRAAQPQTARLLENDSGKLRGLIRDAGILVERVTVEAAAPDRVASGATFAERGETSSGGATGGTSTGSGAPGGGLAGGTRGDGAEGQSRSRDGRHRPAPFAGREEHGAISGRGGAGGPLYV